MSHGIDHKKIKEERQYNRLTRYVPSFSEQPDSDLSDLLTVMVSSAESVAAATFLDFGPMCVSLQILLMIGFRGFLVYSYFSSTSSRSQGYSYPRRERCRCRDRTYLPETVKLNEPKYQSGRGKETPQTKDFSHHNNGACSTDDANTAYA